LAKSLQRTGKNQRFIGEMRMTILSYSILALIVLLIMALGVFFHHRRTVYNPRRILAHPFFKNRLFKDKTVEIFSSDKSVSAYFWEDHSAPMINLHFSFDKAGFAYEKKPGVASLLAATLFTASKKYDKETLQNLLNDNGIRCSFYHTADTVEADFTFVKESTATLISLFQEAFYHPVFTKDELSLSKNKLETKWKKYQEDPYTMIVPLYQKDLFGNHPYANNPYQDAEVLAKLTAKDLTKHMEQCFAKDVLDIGLAGDLTPMEASALLDGLFANLKPTSDSADLPVPQPEWNAPHTELALPCGAQTFISCVFPAVERTDPDFPAFRLICNILAHFRGILQDVLREQNALTYGVHYVLRFNNASSRCAIRTSSQHPDKLIPLMVKTYNDTYQKGIPAEWFERHKKAYIDKYTSEFNSLSSIVAKIHYNNRSHLSTDYGEKELAAVKALTLEQLNDVFKRRFPSGLQGNHGARFYIGTPPAKA
jgi:zinc protease